MQNIFKPYFDLPEMMVFADLSGKIQFINRALQSVVPYDGKQINDLIPPSTYQILDRGKGIYEAELNVSSSSKMPVEVHENTIDLCGTMYKVYILHDISQWKNISYKLIWADKHDIQTGLLNRKAFITRLTQLLAMATATEDLKFSIAIINMDHFKSINATVGTDGGDRCLSIIANRIRSILEKCDIKSELYRTSGDEFAILLFDNNEIRIKDALTAVLKNIEEIYQVDSKIVYPSASIGVVIDAVQYDNAEEIFEKAMEAMKSSKFQGLGVITIYDSQFDQQVDTEFFTSVLQMRHEISEAVIKEEFVPYFQPVYTITDRKLGGFETLVRWKHPLKGFLAPGSFIPYAERIGVISDIDRYIIKCALTVLSFAPHNMYFSSNGSARLMQLPDVAQIICNMLDETNVDASRFILEVTESALINDVNGVKDTIDIIKDKGCKVFLDDFGTGYSSMSYLHSFPFDCIKLDQSFVRHVFTSHEDERLLRVIIDMGNALGMDTLAEGVETEEQLEWLKKAGCKKAQGYFFSKPLPWNEAKKLF